MTGKRSRRSSASAGRQTAAAAISATAVCGLPLPIGFGRRPDGSMFITCGEPEVHAKSFSFPGTGPETLALAQALNAIPEARSFLRDLLLACRDNDNDVVVPSAIAERIEPLLLAFGGRP